MLHVSRNYSNVLYIPPLFLAFHIPFCTVTYWTDICTVTIKNIRNMLAVSTNQIVDLF